MNETNSIVNNDDKRIYIVKSILGNHRYRIEGSDGLVKDYVSNQDLLLNEIISISINRDNNIIQRQNTENTSISQKSERILSTEVNKDEVEYTKPISTIRHTVDKNYLNTNNNSVTPLKKNTEDKTKKQAAQQPIESSQSPQTVKTEKVKRKSEVEKIEPHKNFLFSDIEKDRYVLHYIEVSKSMNPMKAVDYLIEKGTMQSVFALYEIFYDSMHGGGFGDQTFSYKYIKSTIDRIPKMPLFKRLIKVMDSDLLHTATHPYIDQIRQGGFRAYRILYNKLPI